MSSEPEYQNYSQINLNAIKNTKLFQKFMQNKSGLISSGSLNNIVNPRASGTQKERQQTEVRQTKWSKNLNRNKAISMTQNIQNSDQKAKKQQNQVNVTFKNPFEQQKIIIQRTVQYQTVPNKSIEEEIRETYTNKIYEQRKVQYQTISQKPQQIQVQQIRNNNPSVASNRRKRNFNPNFQTSRNNNQQQQQSFKIQPMKSERINDQQKFISYSSNLSNQRLAQSFPQNNLNLYNTSFVQQKSYFQPEQKLQKTQFSPPRNQYPHNYQIQDQKMNVNQLNSSSTNIPPVITQSQYKQKYEALLKKYEELKLQIKNENKNRKKEFTSWQHEIDLIKQKLFDVQSREDSLLIENQRLKQKWQSENLLKMKTQQENKQLGYKIKQLQDQLSMKENHMKQRFEQANYWKTQSDVMKQDLHTLKLNFQKRNDEYNLLYGDYQIVKKQRDNKDYLLEDLRRNIAFLVEQNSAAKDQIFKLVTKLYQLEQENQMLRNDVKRQSFDNSQLNNYMKDLQQQSRDRIQSSNLQRLHERPHERPHQRQFEMRNQRPIHKNQSFILKQQNTRPSLTEQERPNPEKQTRRRGEFARQRGQLTRNQRNQRDERPIPTTQNIHNVSISQERHQNQPKQPQISNNKMGRINQILQELEKIKDMKAMNGAIRRRKIDLERQLQQLETQ